MGNSVKNEYVYVLKKLIKLHVLQFIRWVIEVGIIRSVFLLSLLSVLFLYIHSQMESFNHVCILTSVVWVCGGILAAKRKDYILLYQLCTKVSLVLSIEYLILFFPFSFLLIFRGYGLIAIVFNISLYLLTIFKWVNLKQSKSLKYTMFVKHIPTQMFEWKSGVRSNFILLLLVYITSILGVFHIYLSFISLAFMVMAMISFYSFCEPHSLLVACDLNPLDFIRLKLMKHLIFLLKCVAPIFLISLIHFDYILYMLYGIAILVNGFILIILTKYTLYRPNMTLHIIMMLLILFILLSFIPYIFICLIILNLFLWRKAQMNLKSYLK